MSLYDYKESQEIDSKSYEFYSLIMSAMRKADDYNLNKLADAFPEVFRELKMRYNAPGGLLENELKNKI